MTNLCREIDSCHSNPKEQVRRFLRRSAVSTKAGSRSDDDDQRTTGFESPEDIVSFLRHLPGYNAVRQDGSIDSKGFYLYIRAVKVAEPQGKQILRPLKLIVYS